MTNEPKKIPCVGNPQVRIEEGKVVSTKPRCVPWTYKTRFLFTVLFFLIGHWRRLFSVLAIAVGIYLLWTGFSPDTHIDAMRKWLKNSGDADLLRYYEEAKDVKERVSKGIAFKAYEKRYGKGAWVQHFKQENPGKKIAYQDIAELALGISTAKERDEFLASHAATYETCVQNGERELAFRYGNTLKELQGKGGKEWRIASGNPFSICVYDAVKKDADLWNWYLDNAKWCDSFLLTLEPQLEDGSSADLPSAVKDLADAVKFIRNYSSLLKQFSNEIGALSENELKEIADGDNLEECKANLFAACPIFVVKYHNVLEPMLKATSGISMLEAMHVVANNHTAFGLGEEDAIDSPNKGRNAAMGFIRIHDERKIIWDFATDERGVGCITFCEKVDNYEWCEQVIGMFGEADVVSFLDKYYGDPPQLLRVATETLYRYQELGWAVLNEYCDNPQVKRLLLNPRIGSRLAPYYLKKGYDGFSQLDNDARWIDELLDKNGNVKRLDVDWYEMLPVGGDVATVVKKWVQDRPVTAGDLAWAAVDVADTAAMAFSFGMSKAVTTGVNTATKTTTKRVGQRMARKIARDAANNMTRKLARTAVRRTAKKVGPRKIPFLKKVNKWFRKAPGVTLRESNSALRISKKTNELLRRSWKAARNIDPKKWQKVYKGCKALMWCRYLGHTVPDKGPDFTYTVLNSAGEFVGRSINSLVEGAGDGLKAAVREALGMPKEGNYRWLNFILGGGFCILGLFMLLKTGNGRHAALK